MRTRPASAVVAAAAALVLTTAGVAVAAQPAPAVAAPAPQAAAGLSAELLEAMHRDLGLDAQQARERITAELGARETVARLDAELGAAGAGAWLDAGTAVVATTDVAAVARIEAAGARAQLVERTGAELDAVLADLDTAAGGAAPAGVNGWHRDPKANTVVVDATDRAAAAEFVVGAGVAAAAVVIEQQAGPLTASQGDPLRGGAALVAPATGIQCSAGFAATDGTQAWVLTAGHCTSHYTPMFTGSGELVGTADRSTFGGSDYGALRVENPNLVLTNEINFGPERVIGPVDAPLGATVCMAGSVTGFTCGSVTATGATAAYDAGPVLVGLTRTNYCQEHGDSGGQVVLGNFGVGIHSGGMAGCAGGFGEAYFQPLVPVLNAYGLVLLPL